MGAKDHKESADTQVAKFSIFTITDTKTIQDDVSGKLAYAILTKFGHTAVDHRIIKNDRKLIEAAIAGAIGGDVDLVVTVGGTGISKKDMTVDSVRPLIAKELPGFGELFRAMSLKEIGTAAIMTRAMLGVSERQKLICCLPGSEKAVKLALEGILVNELKHLTWELKRY